MDVNLIDGTYELFRHYFAVPGDYGAVRGVLGSMLYMLENGTTHIGVATDHVIESFRNDLYAGYKTGEGVEPALMAQFPVLEEGLEAMGMVVWAMTDFEADDALAAAAAKAAQDPNVSQVRICTPDKDLAQCVVGTRVVQVDRRRSLVRDESGVVEKFGVSPTSIPDFLAVVGDTADGYPGIAKWGEKGAASVLARYQHLEQIPKNWRDWHPSIKKAEALAENLFGAWDDALLFRTLATLRLDAPVFDSLDTLRWTGPRPEFAAFTQRIQSPDLLRRAEELHVHVRP
ncbi:MAG TPA: 5'-3' exonuclease H3TH domain-containing protein [Gemmatimonadaceae bacterium]|nr:5'-3' exonuclease H3TH domain-containing protein [Gemmatimonadaceae bacterium]